MTSPQKNSGFTIMEVIITIALFSIILLILFSLYEGYNKNFASQQAIIDVSGSARTTLNELQAYTLEADQVSTTHNFSGTTYSSNSATLVLELPSRDSSGELVSGKYDYVVFYQSGSKLYRLALTDASSSRKSGLKLLTGYLTSLTFTYSTSDLTQAKWVGVDIQTQKQASGQTYTARLQQQLYLRNH